MKLTTENKLLCVVVLLVTISFTPAAFSQKVAAKGGANIIRCVEQNGARIRAVTGIELGSNDKTIRLLDLRTFREVEISKEFLRSKKTVTDQEAVSHLGLGRFVAWKLSRKMPSTPKVGQIASVDRTVVYINRGKKQNVTKGEHFDAFRGDKEIKDPKTGEILGIVRRKIGRLEILEVHEKLSKAKLLGNLETELKVGDIVEPVKKSRAIAVLPLTDSEGKIVTGGLEIANEIIAALSKLNMEVVERTKLTDVLDELIIQRSGVFDETTIRKVGNLVGARSILVGTIIPNGAKSKVSMRLLDVATGRVQYALSVETGSQSLTSAGTGSSRRKRTRSVIGKGWVQLFPFIRPESNEKYSSGGNRIKPVRNLPLKSIKEPHRMGDFKINGIMVLENGRIARSKDGSTAIRIENLDDFEMEMVAKAEGVGGMFLLVGWQNGNGYLLEHLNLRTSGSTGWNIIEFIDGKAKDYGDFNHGFTWKGDQTLRLKVEDKRVSLSIGNSKLLKERKIENYNQGDLIIGTFNSRYGGKVLQIAKIRVRKR